MILNSSEQIRIQNICPKKKIVFVSYPICKVLITKSLFYTDITIKYT